MSNSHFSGVWLLLRQSAAPCFALPVPGQACLSLTRAVLAQRADLSDTDASKQLWALAGSDPTIAVWLAHEDWCAARQLKPHDSVAEPVLPDCLGGYLEAVRYQRHAPSSLLRRLSESLVVSGQAFPSDVQQSLLSKTLSCKEHCDRHTNGHNGSRSREELIFLESEVWLTVIATAKCEPFEPEALSLADVLVVRREYGERWLTRLNASGHLRERGGQMDSRATNGVPPSLEGVVLRDAVSAVLSMHEQVTHFQEAVGEACLEATRELAYGAGHEINNPLANIATRAQALLLEEHDPERRRRLSTIVDQSFRARDMIGGLMLFARPPKSQRVATDLGSIMQAAIDSIQSLVAARNVRLEYSPPPVPLEVVVDRAQIEEAVRAIAVNALEAVSSGGRVVLSGCRRLENNGDSWCEVRIVDEGRGMDTDTRRRAFAPFFSGREAGRGVGLGLSKAWRLIENNGGDVTIASRLGQGTQVSIRLPLNALAEAEAGVSGCP